MWETFSNAAILFVRGKLFRDFGAVVKKTLIGNVSSAVCLIVLVKLGLPLWIAVILASVIFGALQPWLFKDLKYA